MAIIKVPRKGKKGRDKQCWVYIENGLGNAVVPLAAGSRAVTLGDSIMQFANQCTGAGDIRNDADSELHMALYRLGKEGHRIKSQVWHDAANITGEVPDRVSVYGATTRVATGSILFSGGNMGYAGDTALGANLRLNAAKNSTAALLIYAAGTNVGSEVETIGKITEACNYAAANGMRIIVSAIRPRAVSLSPTGIQISTGTRDRNLNINAWIRVNVPLLGGTVWDQWEDLRDPQYPAGDPLYGMDKPGTTRDGVHLTPIGAWLSSRTLALAISEVVSEGSWFNPDCSVNNLIINPTMIGTGGTANNGASGTLPNNCFVSCVLSTSNFTGSISGTALTFTAGTNPIIGQIITGAGVSAGTRVVSGTAPNWVVNNSQTVASTSLVGAAPVSCVTSVKDNPDGGQAIVMDFTSSGMGAPGVNNLFNLSFTNPTTGFTSTDYIQAGFETNILAGSVDTLMPGLQATLGQGSNLAARGFGQAVDPTTGFSQPFPTESMGVGWIVTEPLLVGARTSFNARLQVAIRSDIVGTRRIEVNRRYLRIVPSPVVEFPWVP